jgi:hypothetical protein
MRPLSMLLAALTVPVIAAAQTPPTRSGFGISFGFGAGSAGAECNSCSSERDGGLSGYLRLGGYLRPNVFLAAQTNGWVHSEDGVDETLGFLTGVALWYPNVASGLYLKGGLGLASYVATDGTDEISAVAPAMVVGGGYDFRVGKNFSLTPFANYLRSMQGELKANDISTGFNLSANLFQIGLGFTWH